MDKANKRGVPRDVRKRLRPEQVLARAWHRYLLVRNKLTDCGLTRTFSRKVMQQLNEAYQTYKDDLKAHGLVQTPHGYCYEDERDGPYANTTPPENSSRHGCSQGVV
jgi:hypothetical protein